MVAAQCNIPVACVAMLPPDSAATAYCDGMLSSFTDLDALHSSRGCDASSRSLIDIVACSLHTRSIMFPNPPTRFAHLEGIVAQDQPGNITAAEALHLFGKSQHVATHSPETSSSGMSSMVGHARTSGKVYEYTNMRMNSDHEHNMGSKASSCGTVCLTDWLPPLGQSGGARGCSLRRKADLTLRGIHAVCKL
jgi:hypothetical protein